MYLARPHNVSGCTLLQTARATVYAPLNDDVSCQAPILFDLGSQKSYVSRALKNQLGLIPIRTDKILLKTFGSNEPILKTCEVVQISIQCQHELQIFIQAYVVNTVCSPISNQFIEVASSNYPHLQSLPLADCNSDHGDLNVQILIGGDFYWSFMQSEVIRGEAGYGPTAVLSRLGYVLSGPVEIPYLNDVTSNFNMFQTMKVETTVLQEDITLKGELSKFWQLDSLGIIDDIASESDVYSDFNRKIKFNGIRYQVSLPFKEQHTLIPDNYGLCRNRLYSLLRRLRQRPEILREYNEIINQLLQSGVIEVVHDPHEKVQPGSIHYIPHKEILRSDKSTTRLRIVYDASSKISGQVSINECLHPGPPFTPMIFDILIRFRVHKIALVGDLEKAFLNVEVDPEQRNLLRFLWVDNIESDDPNFLTFKFCRILFGLVSSPFGLNATVRNHIRKYEQIDPQFVREVIQSLYVDDFASGKNSFEGSFELYQKLKYRFSEGGFNMRKWASNSDKLMEMIGRQECELPSTVKADVKLDVEKQKVTEDDESYPKVVLNNNVVCNESEIKVLGSTWNRESDKLKFDFSVITRNVDNAPLTKRVLLSATARFFDPLGLGSPIILPLKVMFQKACCQEIGWDDPPQ